MAQFQGQRRSESIRDVGIADPLRPGRSRGPSNTGEVPQATTGEDGLQVIYEHGPHRFMADTDTVMEMQRNLAGAGFYDGEIDGDFGPTSRAAAQAWGEAQGIADPVQALTSLGAEPTVGQEAVQEFIGTSEAAAPATMRDVAMAAHEAGFIGRIDIDPVTNRISGFNHGKGGKFPNGQPWTPEQQAQIAAAVPGVTLDEGGLRLTPAAPAPAVEAAAPIAPEAPAPPAPAPVEAAPIAPQQEAFAPPPPMAATGVTVPSPVSPPVSNIDQIMRLAQQQTVAAPPGLDPVTRAPIAQPDDYNAQLDQANIGAIQGGMTGGPGPGGISAGATGQVPDLAMQLAGMQTQGGPGPGGLSVAAEGDISSPMERAEAHRVALGLQGQGRPPDQPPDMVNPWQQMAEAPVATAAHAKRLELLGDDSLQARVPIQPGQMAVVPDAMAEAAARGEVDLSPQAITGAIESGQGVGNTGTMNFKPQMYDNLDPRSAYQGQQAEGLAAHATRQRLLDEGADPQAAWNEMQRELGTIAGTQPIGPPESRNYRIGEGWKPETLQTVAIGGPDSPPSMMTGGPSPDPHLTADMPAGALVGLNDPQVANLGATGVMPEMAGGPGAPDLAVSGDIGLTAMPPNMSWSDLVGSSPEISPEQIQNIQQQWANPPAGGIQGWTRAPDGRIVAVGASSTTGTHGDTGGQAATPVAAATAATASLMSPVSGTFIGGGKSHYGADRRTLLGGTRPHSGADWQAENGSPVVSMAGGTVLYSGKNRGYGANIVIQENDGNIRRYAAHGSVINAKHGDVIQQGQVIGTIGDDHLHYEQIAPTLNGKPNPVYQAMVDAGPGPKGRGKFVDTSYQKGTVDPAVALGLMPGTAVQEGVLLPGQDAALQSVASTTPLSQLPAGEEQAPPAVSPQDFFGGANIASLPAGMRNNNPGNLKYDAAVDWVGSMGPSANTDEGVPQVVFSSPQAGMNAAAKLAYNKYTRDGLTTLNSIMGDQEKGWSPSNPAAPGHLAATMGIGPNDDLHLDNPENLQSFMKAMVLQEHGPASAAYTDEQYAPAVARAVTGVPTTAVAQASGAVTPTTLAPPSSLATMVQAADANGLHHLSIAPDGVVVGVQDAAGTPWTPEQQAAVAKAVATTGDTRIAVDNAGQLRVDQASVDELGTQLAGMEMAPQTTATTTTATAAPAEAAPAEARTGTSVAPTTPEAAQPINPPDMGGVGGLFDPNAVAPPSPVNVSASAPPAPAATAPAEPPTMTDRYSSGGTMPFGDNAEAPPPVDISTEPPPPGATVFNAPVDPRMTLGREGGMAYGLQGQVTPGSTISPPTPVTPITAAGSAPIAPETAAMAPAEPERVQFTAPAGTTTYNTMEGPVVDTGPTNILDTGPPVGPQPPVMTGKEKDDYLGPTERVVTTVPISPDIQGVPTPEQAPVETLYTKPVPAAPPQMTGKEEDDYIGPAPVTPAPAPAPAVVETPAPAPKQKTESGERIHERSKTFSDPIEYAARTSTTEDGKFDHDKFWDQLGDVDLNQTQQTIAAKTAAAGHFQQNKLPNFNLPGMPNMSNVLGGLNIPNPISPIANFFGGLFGGGGFDPRSQGVGSDYAASQGGNYNTFAQQGPPGSSGNYGGSYSGPGSGSYGGGGMGGSQYGGGYGGGGGYSGGGTYGGAGGQNIGQGTGGAYRNR